MHVRDGLPDPEAHYIDPERYHPFGRMFGRLCARTRSHFAMRVPSFEKRPKRHTLNDRRA